MRELTSTDMPNDPSTQDHHHNTTNVNDMDWNNTELIALYQELDQHDSLLEHANIHHHNNQQLQQQQNHQNQPQQHQHQQTHPHQSIVRKQQLIEDNRLSFTYLHHQPENGGLQGIINGNSEYHQFLDTNGHQEPQVVVDTSLWEILEPDYNQINQIMGNGCNANSTGYLQSPTI